MIRENNSKLRRTKDVHRRNFFNGDLQKPALSMLANDVHSNNIKNVGKFWKLSLKNCKYSDQGKSP